ncbi:helix-turn-helix domain-containing protein [Actinoplanes sp. KI2]|uniref:ArsR/SmtB family transcription factor n=1 Tax=Actinoplanes sp. KI2 TaxID=2983315 RepID=UPI0021D61100|nr:helix-turn-helix domain-containing protein [Actinoplanes sp. KI2]MCU7724104.1 helix-turn-helix domain-containing protein [Actinoplanes sp. KI2]
MAEGRTERDGMRIADPRVMRALAHPARIEIVEYLNDTGAAVSATEVAGMVGLSPSATSYHLRELAKYDLVEQAPSRGDGRERLWRGKSHSVRIDPDLDEPGARAASEALVDLYLHRDQARAVAWLARVTEEPPEWRDLGAIMGQRVLVTADELRELNEKVRDLVEPYAIRKRQADPPAGVRRVTITYSSIPEV